MKKNINKYLKDNGINIEEKWIYLNNEKSNYKIRSNGEVLSVNFNKTGKSKLRKISISRTGYRYIVLHHKGKMYKFQLHQLVAKYFIPNPENKSQVNHIDGDKSNNDVSNLEWVTSKENIHHALKTGLIKTGEDRYNSIVSNDTVEEICKEFVKNELTIPTISKKYNVKIGIIRDILRKKSWKCISDKYDFSNYNKKGEPGTKGENNSLATINENTVHKICNAISIANKSLSDISKEFGVSYKIVQHIYNRSSWRSVSSQYDFTKYMKTMDKSRKGKYSSK